jgi:DNA-binding NtrC family response regulator
MMKIMIIEDEAAIAQLLKELFEWAGHECKIFYNPREGVAEARVNSFDLVFSDICMPGMNGLQVLEALMSIDGGNRVILMTGYADVDNAIEAVNKGAYAFFRKPFDTLKIMDTVAEVERKLESRKDESDIEGELIKLCIDLREIELSMKGEYET